jgi:hypothetical protein
MDKQDVFTALRALLAQHAKRLVVVHDSSDHFYVNSCVPDAKGKAVFFGAVKRSGSKQLFHLMPVYTNPELLEGASPALKKRMQGKSCFNFQQPDPALQDELGALVQRAAELWQAQGRM